MVIETIVNYWLEFLLGLIATGLGIAAKKFYSLYKAEKNHQKTKEQKKFYEDLEGVVKKEASQSRNNESQLQEQITLLKEGILCIQSKAFKQECRRFLEPDYEFTVAEFEELEDDHDVYNKLGGNNVGDKLFRLVEEKASNILTDDK